MDRREAFVRAEGPVESHTGGELRSLSIR
jgi:hypothetical protein